jgi:HAE1 family hydrophobic/amphiphilic exporter-1
MNITQLSVKRPTLIVVLFTVLVFLGLYCYNGLNYELLPQFTSPVFTIATGYPGASPSEVENNITKKIEDAISTVESVESIRSISQEGLSVLLVEVALSSNIDYVLQESQRKLAQIKNTLPEGILEPTISKFSVNDFPIMSIGATATVTPAQFHDLLKNKICPELQRIEGVGAVSLIGDSEREIKVNLDATKLDARDISIMQAVDAVRAFNMSIPAGRIRNENSETNIRVSTKFLNVDDIANVVVAKDADASPVKISDIADVADVEKEPQTLARINGKSSVGIAIQKQADANTVEVSHRVLHALDRLSGSHAREGLKFEVPTNSSEFTEKAAKAVMSDLLNVVILVALVMLLFLHSLRNAFIVMIAVPLSIVISFVGMYLLHYTLNMMTLLAMSLIIGILVDDAIVVLENIYRHLEMGKNNIDATLEGRSEIAFTTVAITLVDVVVFLPIALSTSIISPLIRPYAMVVVVSTLLSMLVAFTVVPLLTSRIGRLNKPRTNSIFGRISAAFERMLDLFSEFLHRVLILSFRNKTTFAVIVLVLFIVTVALIPAGFVGSEFASMGDTNEFIIQMELPRDATLKETNEKAQEAEQILYGKPEIKTVYSKIGASGSGILGEYGSTNLAELAIKLNTGNKRGISSLAYANTVKNELLTRITGAHFTVAVVNQFVGSADDSPLQIIVKSDDPDSLGKYAGMIKSVVESTPGTVDVRSSYESIGPEITVEPDKERMLELGLSAADIGAAMRTAFSGNTDAKYRDGQNEYDINITLDEDDRKSLRDVASMSFATAAGQRVKLSQFARITQGNSSTKLERYDRTSSVSIEGQVIGRSTGDTGDDIKQRIESLALPACVTIGYDGDMKYQSDAMGSLGFALLASIFLVYMIMVALYESYVYPLVVLVSIPLAIIGAVLALALSNSNISIFSMIGMIMLVGLVAKNAILVVDFTNHLKKRGYGNVRALIMSTRLRLRPVLMTTMSMVIGLLPIALASGAASEWKSGLAWVLIGGLTSSMLLTLVVVPVVYLVTDTIRASIMHRMRQAR